MTWDTLQFRINYSVLGIDCWLLTCYAGIEGNKALLLLFFSLVCLWMASTWTIMIISERKRNHG